MAKEKSLSIYDIATNTERAAANSVAGNWHVMISNAVRERIIVKIKLGIEWRGVDERKDDGRWSARRNLLVARIIFMLPYSRPKEQKYRIPAVPRKTIKERQAPLRRISGVFASKIS